MPGDGCCQAKTQLLGGLQAGSAMPALPAPLPCRAELRCAVLYVLCCTMLAVTALLRCASLPRQDPVPRVPKIVYKHAGHRVYIDEEGDIIVRPSYFEHSVLTRAGGWVRAFGGRHGRGVGKRGPDVCA